MDHLQQHRVHAITELERKRDAVMQALDEYLIALQSAAQAVYMDKDERRNHDVSAIQVKSAQRVLWMD